MPVVSNYIKYNVLPALTAVLLLVVYRKTFSQLNSNSAQLVRELNWKDGLILVISYCVVKIILSPLFKVKIWYKSLFISLILYCIIYGIIAFPYLIVSFCNLILQIHFVILRF
jgi:hypothetical protein